MMGFRSWLSGLIGGREQREVLRLAEAISPFVGLGGTVDPDDALFKPMGSGQAKRNVPATLREQSLESAYYLYHSNPLAHRLVETQTSYVCGDKPIQIRCAESAVQKQVDRFTGDPLNRWDEFGESLGRWVSVFGEQCYTATTNAAGRVRLGYIEPASISDVQHAAGNSLDTTAVVIGQGDKKRILPHVRFKDDTQLREGTALYFGINMPPNATRGLSDLLASLDWLDALDNFMVSSIDRIRHQNAYAWIVTMQGGDAKKINEYLKTVPPPRPGQVLGTTSQVKWDAIGPKIGGQDLPEFGRMLKIYAAMSFGLPPHWIGEEGSANRATASEMQIPVVKQLKARQETLKRFVRQLVDFVIDRAIDAGQLSVKFKTGGVGDRSYDVIMPTIWGNDAQTVSNAAVNLTNALTLAVKNDWLSQDEAAQTFRFQLAQIGADLPDIDERSGDRKERNEDAVTPAPVVLADDDEDAAAA